MVVSEYIREQSRIAARSHIVSNYLILLSLCSLACGFFATNGPAPRLLCCIFAAVLRAFAPAVPRGFIATRLLLNGKIFEACPQHTIDLLNRLIEINKDAEAGLRTAAENVRNSELETIFSRYARQHAKFIAELQPEVDRLDGNYTESGTVGGAVHRGWMDVKSTLTGHSARAMLASESREQSAEVAYSDAADAHPTGQTRTLIDRQHQQIKEFHTRLCRLVNEAKDGIDFQSNE